MERSQNMKTIKLFKLPECDICWKNATYRAPTDTGMSINMCEMCAEMNSTLALLDTGTRFELEEGE